MELIENKLDELDFSQPLSFINIVHKVNNNKVPQEFSKKKIIHHLHNSNKYQLVKPLEVGSGKKKLNVWKKVL
jgi:hypothetical protein